MNRAREAWLSLLERPLGEVLSAVRLEAAPCAAVDRDALVAFPFGLEKGAARDLVRNGELPTRKIGRKVYARASAVVGLVPETPGENPPVRVGKKTDAKAAYLALVSPGAR